MVAELEEARALGMLYNAGMAAQAHDHLRSLGRRGTRVIGFNGVGRNPRGRAKTTRCRLPQHRQQQQRISRLIRISHSGKIHQQVALDIQDPETGLSAWKRTQLSRISERLDRDAEGRVTAQICGSARLDQARTIRPSSHTRVRQLSLGYGGEDEGGIYHSTYDSFYWYTRFSDTSFVYGRALAQTVGTAVLRLANADLLPSNSQISGNRAGLHQGAAIAAGYPRRTDHGAQSGGSMKECSKRSATLATRPSYHPASSRRRRSTSHHCSTPWTH